ncbi:MAG: hypothetical protein FJ202_09775 [Gemmatimonadetes bacterium]|nr:hypothetical protein [Gemmatimonadota bacterium]
MPIPNLPLSGTHLARAARIAVLGGVTAAASGCMNPQALADIHEQLTQAADAVNDIRINMDVMRNTIDSLTIVVAKQDSTITRLATATNVQVVK